MWINFRSLVSYLENMVKGPGLYGYQFIGTPAIRDEKNKWYVPYEQYKNQYYPNYLSGTAYLIVNRKDKMSFTSKNKLETVIGKLYASTFEVGQIFMEDVYITGLAAQKAQVPRTNAPGFHYSKVEFSVCAYLSLISTHHVSDEEKYIFWSKLNNKTFSEQC